MSIARYIDELYDDFTDAEYKEYIRTGEVYSDGRDILRVVHGDDGFVLLERSIEEFTRIKREIEIEKVIDG
tara:strand:- start:7323 stop:7535 length:213 start_codon:yes stop_codon:yes gene_type:complete